MLNVSAKYIEKIFIEIFVCTFLQDILLPLGQPKLSIFAIDGLALCLTVCDKYINVTNFNTISVST